MGPRFITTEIAGEWCPAISRAVGRRSIVLEIAGDRCPPIFGGVVPRWVASTPVGMALEIAGDACPSISSPVFRGILPKIPSGRS